MVVGRIGGESLAKIKLWTSWVKPLPHERRNQYAFVPLLRRSQPGELKRFSIFFVVLGAESPLFEEAAANALSNLKFIGSRKMFRSTKMMDPSLIR